jgi:hypothetical protein
MLYTNHRCHRHLRMRRGSVFKFNRTDPFTARLDHILRSVTYLHHSIGADGCNVTCWEPTIYQGCDTKYYYNEAAPPGAPEGICPCGDTICPGTGDGRSIGACKEITISPFHTGSIIITGARRFEQIQKAYVFINKILRTHCTDVIRPHPATKPAAKPATKPAAKPATKKATA